MKTKAVTMIDPTCQYHTASIWQERIIIKVMHYLCVNILTTTTKCLIQFNSLHVYPLGYTLSSILT